jgi:hypothetical protein
VISHTWAVMWGKKINKKLVSEWLNAAEIEIAVFGRQIEFERLISFSHSHIAALVLFIASSPSLTYRSLFARPSSLSLCLILLSQGVHPPCYLALLLQGLRLRAPPFNNLCIYQQLTIGRARTAGIVQIMTRQTTLTSSGNLNTPFFSRGYVLRFFTQSLTIRFTLFRR